MQHRDQIVEELMSKFKKDPNVLAIALCTRPESSTEKNRLDFLVVVSKMPFDLDLFGRKKLNVQGYPVVITYFREERLRTAITEEAGCWLVSGMVLYSDTLHDPFGILLRLRKAVNSVPLKARMDALYTWLNQARAFPVVIYGRKKTDGPPEENILGEQAPIARSLFLLNGRPPQFDSTIFSEMMDLQIRPQGLEDLPDIVNSFDKYKSKKFRKAEKDYVALISEIEDLARNMKQ